jgi:hypothetical protein
MDDTLLAQCNETELLWLARHQGLGHLRRGLPKEVLIAIVSGSLDPQPEHFAGTAYSREKLEAFIKKHWDVVMSQLPGCNGQCITYACSEGRHLMCFEPNRDGVQ